MFLKQSQLKFDTIKSYSSSVKFNHINYHLGESGFDLLHITLIIKKEKNFFSGKKPNPRLVIKNIFEKIGKEKSLITNDFNANKTFKIAQVRFFRLEKIKFIAIKAKKLC